MAPGPVVPNAHLPAPIVASLGYQDLQQHGTIDQCLDRAAKAFSPFERSQFPDSTLDKTFADALGAQPLTRAQAPVFFSQIRNLQESWARAQTFHDPTDGLMGPHFVPCMQMQSPTTWPWVHCLLRAGHQKHIMASGNVLVRTPPHMKILPQ